MSYTTINPANEEKIKEHAYQSPTDVERALEASVRAQKLWRQTPVSARQECVQIFERQLTTERVRLARLITTEMGKLEREALAEIDKSIKASVTLRELYPQWKLTKEYSMPTGFSIVRRPLGVVLGIMPWNFPLWQVVRFAIPTLLSGNSVLLKHAPCTWGVAEWIEKITAQAFPKGLFINLKVDVPDVGRLIGDPRVRGVSLTGSGAAGVSVAGLAGKHLKKCVLELGGSDAYVILDDADVDHAIEICVKSRLLNAGQSCVSAKRFIVTRQNSAAFTESFTAKLKSKVVGDPLDPRTDVGPLARQDLRENLHQQVQRSLSQGARLLLGGTMSEGKGFFYPPTVLSEVLPGQAAFDQELFGPVAAITTAQNEEQAIQLANQSRFGLGAAIFTRDLAKAQQMAENEIEAGMVFINDLVRSDPTVPFGGSKDSGLGRELGREGAFEFTETKTIYAKI